MVDAPTNAPAFTRLDDRAVGVRLAALDEQLAQLETASGPVGELALATVSGLAEIYGQALARALDLVDPALLQRMLSDELIGHLLVLHGIHPSPVTYRTSRVIEGMRLALSARGAEIALVGVNHAGLPKIMSTRGSESGR